MSGRTLAFVFTFLIPVVLVRVFDPAQFGTYKQLFLVFSTLYGIAPFGIASSLFYFLPSVGQGRGESVANALLVLATLGLIGAGALVIATPKLAAWFDNPELTAYLPWIGLYALLAMLSSSLEIVLIVQGKYVYASASYGFSDVMRAAALILPALLFRRIGWLLAGALAVALFRCLFTLAYLWRKFQGSFTPDLPLLKRQLAYSLPFGIAVCVEVLQTGFPQYLVSHRFDPVILAIFAVGCLENPLVELLGSSAGDVMMVKMQGARATDRSRVVLELWHETTAKLALLFFPMVALVVVAAREIIVLVYTERYLASVPILVVWSSLVLLAPFSVDGVLRVFAQTRILLILNVFRLTIIATLMPWALGYGLVSGTLVVVSANAVFKMAGLLRIKTLLGVSMMDLLPWRRLITSLSMAIVSGAVAWGIRYELSTHAIPLMLAAEMAFGALTYGILVWSLNVLSDREKLALREAIAKIGILGIQ
jgi:O-antigen/teichoic acid export membrane protein